MPHVDPLGWTGAPLTDKVRILAVAGEGAFGVVYRAFHDGFGEPVAVKCLRLGDGLSEDERRALVRCFQGEARLLHRLSRRSAHVVQALDVGAATSPSGVWSPYIVMEWLEGLSLEQDLAARAARGEPPRSVEETLDLLAPAVEALCLAHEEHVCHRDLKPANLFLTRKAPGTPLLGAEGLKVLDFGIAKALEASASMTRAYQNTFRAQLSRTALVSSPTVPETAVPFHAFTPRYGAPEQFSVQWGATGPWTDVFALALVIIEVASGKPALPGQDLLQLFVAASDARRRPSLAGRGAAVSDELEAVLQRAVDVDPARRFRSMGDFRAALARARQAGKRGSLGTPSEPPGAGPAFGENRLLTVLFAEPELALSPADSGAGAPLGEEHAELIQRVVTALEGCVQARGGRSEPLAGGGVMAVWGLPRATDADAELAVQAALDMREALARLPVSGLRAGIATGRVLVAPGESRPSGRAVSLASHLARHAAAGTILVSRDTHRQVSGRFTIEPVATGDVVQSVFKVTGPAIDRPALPQETFHGLATKLVGRKAEMARLVDLWESAAEESRPIFVTIVGPPGSGRTRLLAELSAVAPESVGPCTVLAAQGSPTGTGESHGLVKGLLAGAFHIHPDDPREAVLRRLRRGLRRMLSESAASTGTLAGEDESIDLDGVDADIFGRLAETLEDVAALWAPRSTAPAAPPLVLGADDAATPADPRIRAALARLLQTLAARGPVLVLCDDVAWADRASLSLLADLPLRVPSSPVLFVCAARPELFERDPGFGERIPGHVRIDLAPLAQRHIEEMVKDRLRKVEGLRPEVVQRIAARADRLPIAVTELLHLLVDTGAIEARRDRAWVLREEAIDEAALPATVVGLAQARFDRLDAPMRDVLGRAAVIGKTFWASALADVEGAESLLAELCERQIVRPSPASMFPGERQLVFVEGSLHEVAYATLSAALRRELHAAAASWLEGRAGDAGAALLAWHHERAGAKERAASEYVRAASHAEALGQGVEALHHLERAAAIHVSTEDSRSGGASAGDPKQGVFDGKERRVASFQDRALVLLRLGDALRFAGRGDEASDAYDRARARLVRGERRADHLIDPREIAVWEARLDCRKAAILKVRGATAEARVLVEQAIARATRAGAEGETLSMWAMLAVLHRRMRDPAACRRTALSGLRVARAAKLRDGRFRDDLSRLLLALAASFYTEGKMVRAERTYRQAARCVNAEESPHTLGLCLNGIAGTRLARGDLTGAREALLASFKLKERAGDLHQLAIAHNNLAEIRFRLGEREAALDHARRAVALGERIGAASDVPDMYKNVAEISLASGDAAAAVDACERAMKGAAVGGGRVYLAEVGLCAARTARAIRRDAGATPELRARGRALAQALLVFVDESFTEERLRGAAAECRALAQEALEDRP